MPRPDPVTRFLLNIEINADGCWLWCRALSRDGYGWFKVGGRMAVAHRWIYERLVGPIPDDLQLDHLCHSRAVAAGTCSGGRCHHRACCNPEHLEPVTSQTNLLRGATLQAANAAKTECSRGHPFDAKDKRQRYCKTCKRESTRRYREKSRAS